VLGEAANTTVTDAAIARAQRWADNPGSFSAALPGIRRRRTKPRGSCHQLEHTGKGKNDAITKIFNAVGSVPAAKYRFEAEKYRDEAARLREQLAQLRAPTERILPPSVPAP